MFIDSCTLFIPLTKLKILSPALSSQFVKVNLSTGESEDIRSPNSLKLEDKGVSTYYRATARAYGNKGTSEQGISFTLNSKHLRKDYLKGLTIETLETAYKEIMQHNVIEVSLEDFKQSLITDVDLSQDFKLNKDKYEDFNALTKHYASVVKDNVFDQSNKPRRYKGKSNQGLELSCRNASSTLPHVKIYNKEVELLYNSNEFYNYHLKGLTIDKPVRLEINLKTVKNIRKYMNINDITDNGKLKPITLESIASVLKDKGVNAMHNITNQYFDTAKEVTLITAKEKADKLSKQAYRAIELANAYFKRNNSLEDLMEDIELILQLAKNERRAIKDIAKTRYEELTSENNKFSFLDGLIA